MTQTQTQTNVDNSSFASLFVDYVFEKLETNYYTSTQDLWNEIEGEMAEQFDMIVAANNIGLAVIE